MKKITLNKESECTLITRQAKCDFCKETTSKECVITTATYKAQETDMSYGIYLLPSVIRHWETPLFSENYYKIPESEEKTGYFGDMKTIDKELAVDICFDCIKQLAKLV